jgi:hypothetical protein
VSPARLASLDAALAALATHQNDQGLAQSTAQGSTSNQETLRTTLYDKFMVPIGRLAKRFLSDVPELGRLMVPAEALSAGRVGEFMTSANNLVTVAAKYEQQLIAAGMAPDFLANLQAAVNAILTSTLSRNDQVRRQVSATSGLRLADKAVRDELDTLDGLLKDFLKANPQLAAEWRSARRIIRVPVTPLPTGNDASDGTTTTAPAATPAAPAAPALTIVDGTKAAA